jgi:hypothetical protein
VASEALHGTPTDANNWLGLTLSRVLTLCNSTYEHRGFVRGSEGNQGSEMQSLNQKPATKMPIRRMNVTFFVI